MSFRILYVTATALEAEALKSMRHLKTIEDGYSKGTIDPDLLITGVGSVSTAWAMKQWLSVNGRPDLAINGGIAGSYHDKYAIGDVVMPVSDCFADSGIEKKDGFYTLFEAGLSNPGEFPFKNGQLYADSVYGDRLCGILKPVTAITVNTATGTETTKQKLIKKFNPDIETMEGATFFYICAREKIPFLALRAISNKVEVRNIVNWDIPMALKNLSEKINEVIVTLSNR